MRVLGIETSTDMGGVALVEDGVLRAEWTWNLPRGHSVRLIPAVEAVLKGLDWRVEDLDGVAVGVGPGSFTGLRIGLATAKGFALALGKPIVGIPSLDAMVYGLPSSRPLCAITDAKRGELFVAFYHDGNRVRPYQVLTPERVAERLLQAPYLIVGEGALLYREVFEGIPGVEVFPFLLYPKASSVALLGEERLRRGEEDDLSSIVPLYLRPSDAELKGPRP